MINNINSYHRHEFEQSFKLNEIYKKLEQDFGKNNLIWEKFFFNGRWVKHENHNSILMPRAKYKNFSMSVFYYLLPLLENDYDKIYDLGCGRNMFKLYLPRLVGVAADRLFFTNNLVRSYNNIKDPSWPRVTDIDDFENLPGRIKEECIEKKLDISYWQHPEHDHFYGDVEGIVDEQYVLAHQNYFESVFSICALHFCPLTKFKNIVLDFVSMIKPGGRGFLSLNLQRMIEQEPDLSQLFSTANPTTLQYDEYLRNELSTLDLKFLILDIDLELINEGMDGNIRLVIEK